MSDALRAPPPDLPSPPSARPDGHTRTLQWLSDARARLRGRVATFGLPATLAVLLGAALLAVAAAAWIGGGPTFRGVVWTLLGLSVGVTGWRWLIAPWLGLGPDLAVASRVERAVPALKDGLLAVVQLSAPRADADARYAPDAELLDGLSRQVSTQLRAVSLDAALPLWPDRRPLKALGAVALLWAVLAVAAPEWLGRGFAVLFPARTTDGARLVGPLVGDLELTLVYPEHMKRGPRVIPNGTGDLDAPRGTRIRLRATTLEAARSAALRFSAEGVAGQLEQPLTLEGGREVSGEWVLKGAGSWRFVLVSDDGEALAEGFERRAGLELDREPQVTLKLPAEDLEVDDLRALRVEWSASDDFGLSSANVLLALAADAERPEKYAQPGVSGLQTEGHDDLDLVALGAKPGDRFALTVEVFDNDSVDGPKRGVSTTRYVTFRSPEDDHQAIVEALHALVEQLLTVLADRLEVDLRDPRPPGPAARVDAYVAATQSATKTLAELVVRMAADPLTPKEVRLALAGRVGTLEKAVAQEQPQVARQSAALAAGTDAAVRAVAKANEPVIDQVEQTIILIEAMVTRLGLEELAALTEELKSSGERLRGLMQDFKRTGDEGLKARIMRDLARLKARIREIRERLAKLRRELPEEFLNVDGLKNDEVGKGLDETEDQLDKMQKMLEEGRIDDALAEMEKLSNTLDEMSNQLDQDMNELHQETDPELHRALSELMDQTRDLIEQQEQLAQQTDAEAQENEDCLSGLLKNDLARPWSEAKARAGRARTHIEGVDPSRFPSYLAEDVDGARGRADDYLAALERPNLQEAAEAAEGLLRKLETLRRAERYEPELAEGPSARALSEASLEAEQAVRESNALVRDYESLKRQKCPSPPPPPGADGQPQPGEGGQPSPSQLGERQRKLREAAQKLGERMQSQGSRFPTLGEGPPQQAQKAGEQMGQAAEELDAKRPGQARPSQQQAISELQGLMEGLKQAANPQRADRGQRDGQKGSRQEKVEIPGADDHQAPAEFRKDLLEAMKDKAPETYEQQVKRYYESLVE